MVGSTWSWAATVCEAKRATTSFAVKPASAMRARILSTESDGSGTVRSGAGREKLDRPAMNCRRGPPPQLDTPTAPANWMLWWGQLFHVGAGK